MEFVKKNIYDTSGSVVVQSNTATAKNILNRDLTKQWSSTNYADDLTTTTMTINFNQTSTVSRIVLMEHNLKSFTIYYNGLTANTFSMTTSSSTITSDWSTNSESSQFIRTTAVDCTSVSIDMKSTQISNNEKAIGYVVLSDLHASFTKLPNAQGYRPEVVSKEVVHKLSNGGTRVQNFADKFRVDLSLENINQTFRDSLKTVYDEHDEFIFVSFGTTTSWDEILFPCIWQGNFKFFKYADNASSAGFEGDIRLLET